MQGLEMDRRTLVQTTGAVGAGALGLGAVSADEDADHYVVASDAHLGSPFANNSAFESFLTTTVPDIDPDALVISGDCFEMWFRGMSSTLLEFTRISDYFETLEENGTNVTLVAGNHDRRLVTIGEGLDDPPGSPWQIGEEFFFQSGDQEFVAVHGDGPDPVQIDPISEALCTKPDFIGSILAALVGWWEGLSPWEQAGETGAVTVTDSRTVSLQGSYSDPVVVTTQPSDEGPVRAEVSAGLGTTADSIELQGRGGDTEIQYAVFESGRHVLGTSTVVEAGRTVAGDGWRTVTFEEAFDEPPVVLADVQSSGRGLRSAGTDRARARRYRMGGVSTPRIRNVTELGFEMRVDGRADVGFVAVERGDITLDGRRGVAGVGAVRPDSGSVGRAFAETPSVFTTPQTPSGSPGYLALTGEGGLYATESTTVPTPDAEKLVETEWQRRLDEAGLDTDGLPERPPGMAGLEPMSGDEDSITESLLEKYEEFVVFGHTHIPDLGDRYANSGSWTARSPDDQPENTFLEIKNGAVTVWDWSPEGREPLFGP